jgi:hypothetical protein
MGRAFEKTLSPRFSRQRRAPRGVYRDWSFPEPPLRAKRAATVPARSARAFLAHPTRFERVTFAFGALLLTLSAPSDPLPT